jgi:hypothetical protein
MKKEKVMGVVRHTLTFLGGIFVLQGSIDQELVEQIIGATSSIIGVVWSIMSKK